VKRSSAQLTVHYQPEELVGRQVVAAVNLGTRRIATFDSEVLVLGAMAAPTDVVLLRPDQSVPNGTRIA
jgi:tRNA-binding protein